MLNYCCAKTHERFLHRAEPKDGLCFRKWLWLRGTAFTCSCSIKSTTYSLFTPHSTLVIEASCTFSPLPSPKALSMLPVDAMFIGRKRHRKKARCASSLLYLHVSFRQLVWSAISDTCMSGYARQVGFCVRLKRVCCCSRMFFWSRCSWAVLRAAAGTGQLLLIIHLIGPKPVF